MSITVQDIYQTIRDLEYNGHQLTEIEAFLIHTDDLQEFYKAIESRFMEMDDQGKVTICGVKVVDSPYVERGSIFKIFKNKKPYIYPSQATPKDLGISGTIPFPPATGVIDVSTHGESRVIHVQKPLQFSLDDPNDWTSMIDEEKEKKEKEKEEKEKRHSQTRKIELGE